MIYLVSQKSESEDKTKNMIRARVSEGLNVFWAIETDHQ